MLHRVAAYTRRVRVSQQSQQPTDRCSANSGDDTCELVPEHYCHVQYPLTLCCFSVAISVVIVAMYAMIFEDLPRDGPCYPMHDLVRVDMFVILAVSFSTITILAASIVGWYWRHAFLRNKYTPVTLARMIQQTYPVVGALFTPWWNLVLVTSVVATIGCIFASIRELNIVRRGVVLDSDRLGAVSSTATAQLVLSGCESPHMWIVVSGLYIAVIMSLIYTYFHFRYIARCRIYTSTVIDAMLDVDYRVKMKMKINK